MEKKLNFEFPMNLNKNQIMAIKTAPGIDGAVIDSSKGFLQKIPVNRYCPNCSLKKDCNLSVKVDKLANSIFVYGSCLKT